MDIKQLFPVIQVIRLFLLTFKAFLKFIILYVQKFPFLGQDNTAKPLTPHIRWQKHTP